MRYFRRHLDLVPSTTGLHLAALSQTASVQRIAEVADQAAKLGVQIHRLSFFAVGQKPRAGIIPGYGAIPTDQINQRLQRLGACFEM